MKTAYDIIRRPVITEQSMSEDENKKHVKVNTLHVTGKLKRTGRYPAGRQSSWKKAVVTLADDSKSIEFFEGMA